MNNFCSIFIILNRFVYDGNMVCDIIKARHEAYVFHGIPVQVIPMMLLPGAKVIKRKERPKIKLKNDVCRVVRQYKECPNEH